MRVTEAYDILQRNIPRLSMPQSQEERLHDNKPGYRYIGMSRVIAAVNELSKVSGLEAECLNVRQTSIFQTEKDGGIAGQQDWSNLQSYLKDLTKIATRIALVLSSMVPETSPNTIAVKLPEVKDLVELKELIGDIHLALERPVQMVMKETLTVEGVDRGSMWLMLAGSVAGVVKFTFGLLWASNHFLRRQAELDRYVQHTKATDLGDYVLTIEKANGKIMESFAEALTKQLLEGHNVDPEAAATTMNGIKMLADLRKQGLEMQLAANAPKELQEAYRKFIVPEMTAGELTPKIPPQLTAGATMDEGDSGSSTE